MPDMQLATFQSFPVKKNNNIEHIRSYKHEVPWENQKIRPTRLDPQN